jgi:signal transduction histidine kinase
MDHSLFCGGSLREVDSKIKVCVLEDNPGDQFLVRSFLDEPLLGVGFSVRTFGTLADCLEGLGENPDCDVLLVDLKLPDASDLETVTSLSSHCPDAPQVVLTGDLNLETAMRALRLGAEDFISKNENTAHLLQKTIFHSLQRFYLKRKLEMANEREKASNAAKSEFLANMSHEIRTPLNAILGFSQILELSKSLNEEELEYIHSIATAGECLLHIISDILDFSKMESGRMQLEETEFHICQATREVLSLFEKQAEQRGISLTFGGEKDMPCAVVGDPTRYKQILINLLSNALKFTTQGEVEFHLRSIGQTATSCTYEGFVRDTGIGIPSEAMDRLFKPFSQAESSTTRRFGGTGLGLAICKRICHEMGGDITVESTSGEGTRFTFTLTLTLDPKAKDTGHSEGIHPGVEEGLLPESTRMLVVEDNKLNQIIITRLLEKLGIRTEIAIDGEDAMRKMEAADYDVILMDVRMPNRDGLETTRWIRDNLSPDRQPYIIACTAGGQLEDKEKCFTAGMDDYLLKPVTIKRLQEVLLKSAPPPLTTL